MQTDKFLAKWSPNSVPLTDYTDFPPEQIDQSPNNPKRNMSRITLLLVLFSCSCLSSCSVSVPAVAQIQGGETFLGSVSATLTKGRFDLQSPDGKIASGTFKPARKTNWTIDFSISDGRNGRVLINQTGPTSGYGIGKLSNGQKCKLMYGDSAVSMTLDSGF